MPTETVLAIYWKTFQHSEGVEMSADMEGLDAETSNSDNAFNDLAERDVGAKGKRLRPLSESCGSKCGEPWSRAIAKPKLLELWYCRFHE